jgi:4-amino-4-deoxy-L-arabinose transferase-like glycosyltransferase
LIATKHTSHDPRHTVSAGSPWQNWPTSPSAAVVVLLVFYAVMLASLREKSATLDEPGHATAGYTYWKFGDYRLDPENGNLPQRVIALPLVLSRFHFPDRDAPGWKRAEIHTLANQWMYDMGNDTEAILARGRAAGGLFAVALGAIIWMWARRLFGPAGGMLSLTAYVLNPTVLANGALMTSDMASAFFFLLSLYCLWRLFEAMSPQRVALGGLAMGALFVTKNSAVIMIPVALVLAIARVIDRRPIELGPSRVLVTWQQRCVAVLAVTVAHVAITTLIIWACYGFRFGVSPPAAKDSAQFPWEFVLNEQDAVRVLDQLKLETGQREHAVELVEAQGGAAKTSPSVAAAVLQEIRTTVLTSSQREEFDRLMARSLPMRAAAFAVRHHLFPEAYIYGYARLLKSTGARVAFLNGEVKVNDGWWWFFPYTMLVKTPLALFAIVALAVAVTWRESRKEGRRIPAAAQPILPLIVFIVLFLGAAVSSNLNIGHRHILPIYPPLFVLCGAAAGFAESFHGSRRQKFLPPFATWPATLIIVLAIEGSCWFPHYLAYFNGLVRPSQAYRHLVDSSLDWGQDLPALRRYIDKQRPTAPHFVALFGHDSRPDHYGIAARRIYNGISPPLLILSSTAPQNEGRFVGEFLRTHPEYDSRATATMEDGVSTVILKTASELTLKGGTYFIGASCIQPTYPRAVGPWSSAHEATYQRLKKLITPLLSDDLTVRFGALQQHKPANLLTIFEVFSEYRFARLTAHLRKREPDANINYSILVYQLKDAEVVQALDGPPP